MSSLPEDLNNKDMEIYKEDFYSFLPEKITDFHVHLWQKEHFKESISELRQNLNPFLDPKTISGLTFEDFKDITGKIFLGKIYDGLFFGFPAKEVDLSKSNKYVSDVCKKNGCYGFFIPEPGLKDIPKNFFENRFIGFKPYPDLVNYKLPEDFSKLDIDVSIFDFISKKVLEFASEYKLILLIHIPRKGRLKDKRNIEEIKLISKKYPGIKVVLAHAGRSYCYEDIRESIKYLSEIKNLYVDTAMINSFSVIKILIEELGSEKVLYGSDLPIAALKGKNIDINNIHYFVTKEPRPWSLSSKSMELDFTFFIYEIVRAIKLAADELKLSNEQIEQIFYSNAQRMISDINKNI